MTFPKLSVQLLKNKYILSSLAFVVWMSFFDQYNLLFQNDLSDQKKQLLKDYIQLKIQTNTNKQFLNHLNDEAFLEKYAREQFLMSKKGEDIFILEEKPVETASE